MSELSATETQPDPTGVSQWLASIAAKEKPTPQQPQLSAGDAWIAKLGAVFDFICEGAKQELQELTKQLPSGAEAGEALRFVYSELGIPEDSTQPTLDANKTIEDMTEKLTRRMRVWALSVLDALGRQVEDALRRNENDHSDPIIYLPDFAARGTVREVAVSPFPGKVIVASHESVPHGHPLKSVTPLVLPGEPGTLWVIVGKVGVKWMWTSEAKRLNETAARESYMRQMAHTDAMWEGRHGRR